mgnify:CR=1 FL=1
MYKKVSTYTVKIVLITVLTLAFSSCRKYVENVPVQGQRVLVYTQDYRLLLNNRNAQEIGSGNTAILSCDDVELSDPELQTSLTNNTINSAIYSWKNPFYFGETEDIDWNYMYSAIYVYNTVLQGVMDSKGGTAEQRSMLYAEALINRAFTFFTLTNLYAKQYDASTAANDPAIPMLLSPELFVKLNRASVKEVYDQIIRDLQEALPLIPVVQVSTVQPNRGAAYALLAKVYLNMRNFEAARTAAEQSLSLNGSLYDYNTFLTTNILPTQYNDKQILLRKVPRNSFYPLQLSPSLLNLLDTKDLRYELFVKPGSNFYPAFQGMGFWSRENYNDRTPVGLTVNETWLIRAECLARTGKREEALTMVNELRKMRFRPSDYRPVVAASDQDALQRIIDERRREFFGTGLRWFDQKRLNKDAAFARVITRSIGNVSYSLEPNSNAYVFQFAEKLVAQNPELVQNPK